MTLTMTSGRRWRGLVVLLTLPLWFRFMKPSHGGYGALYDA
jgi:hypothetical protein